MSSPPRTRFKLPGQVACAPSEASSSPSTSSTRSLSSLSSRPRRQAELQPEFKVHRLLRSAQAPVADNIMTYILWDFREDPLEAAQYVEQLGTQLSSDTLDEFATEPPMPFLRVICEFPERWEVIVSPPGVRDRSVTSAGGRHTFPVYQPTPLAHVRVPSASVSRPSSRLHAIPPPTPKMPTVPLPSSTPPPLSLFTGSPNADFSAVTMSAPPQPQVQPQPQPSDEVGVTIGDVLTAIFRHLNTRPIRSTELEVLPNNQRKRVQAAYDNRTVLSPTSPVSTTFSAPFPPVSSVPSASSAVSTSSALSSGEPIAGMKKVDLLLKNTWFAGLSVASGEKNTVMLSLTRPTPN